MSSPGDNATLETHDVPSPPGGEAAASRYALVGVKEGSSFVFPLPAAGVLTVGRASEADLCIEDGSISRQHARLMLAEGRVRVSDLGSRNGTRVNGQPVTGSRDLLPGDVVALGTVTLVLQGGGRARPARAALPLEELRRRTAEELERAGHYERPTALLLVGLSRPAETPPAVVDVARAALRPHDALAWASPTELAVLLPEVGEEEARDVAADVAAALASLAPLVGAVHAGVAVGPSDGVDADSLVAAARAAAGAAAQASQASQGAAGEGPWGGTVRTASQLVTRLELGEQTLVLADPAMHGLYALIRRLAATDLPVLVAGETGTGKEFAASAVHHHSPRRGRPFVPVNCAALPDTLVESELFGHEKGAFSGATATRVGLLEAAAGGTVFLDEVGELSLAAQAKLLRAVESGRISRLGGTGERAVDVRLVAATNRDLQEEVRRGRFRQDLLFRLGGATVVLPPLRDRPRDLPVLARTFLEQACRKLRRAPITLSAGALQRLAAHPWPGNVRELRNVMTYAAATVEGDLLEAWHLPELAAGEARALTPVPRGTLTSPAPGAPSTPAPLPAADATGRPPATPFRRLEDELKELERRRMVEALAAAGGVQKRAAQLIGMPLRTFVLKVKQYGLGRTGPAGTPGAPGGATGGATGGGLDGA
jgi:transcriptional regulator with GAF, ATPase, and Fis domain